jgi:hypothetical protein
MTIPNADRAIISPEKLTGYLLNASHKRGGPKARLLLSVGYRADVPERLESDVRSQHLSLDVTRTSENAYGVVHEIEGPIKTPLAYPVVSGDRSRLRCACVSRRTAADGHSVRGSRLAAWQNRPFGAGLTRTAAVGVAGRRWSDWSAAGVRPTPSAYSRPPPVGPPADRFWCAPRVTPLEVAAPGTTVRRGSRAHACPAPHDPGPC